ncbi:MAG: 50S ribosome-binding GTPase [Ignavibacteriales bacterium]|nr:MAG: 50S ribosome-binding GTPase [Ignavibacteriales bacterium]
MEKLQGIAVKRLVFVGRKKAGKAALIKQFSGQADSDLINGEAKLPGVIRLDPYDIDVILDSIDIEDLYEFKDEENIRQIKSLAASDFLIIVLDGTERITEEEKQLINLLRKLSIPHLAAVNKIEYGVNSELLTEIKSLRLVHFEISCKENVGIEALKAKLIRMLP